MIKNLSKNLLNNNHLLYKARKNMIQNFNKIIFLAILSFLMASEKESHAQFCPFPEGSSILAGNNINAAIPLNGNLFWDPLTDPVGHYYVNNITPRFGTFAFDGIWITAKDPNGIIRLAISTAPSGVSNDFFAGPLYNNNGVLTNDCDNFDRTWEVLGYEILLHLADFANNGIIDDPQFNIYAYPAHQNPHFESIHGFPLPNTPQGLAPFHDQNMDGIYDPDDGDFPLPEGVSPNKIPNHLTWGVFNDAAGPHTASQGQALNVEVQLTTWAFYCEEDDLLNNTIFTSHKIINRGNETLDSMVFSNWTDFDLGCFTDDYIGCSPDLNTIYCYNADSLDGINNNDCIGGLQTIPFNPPAQAFTFLNKNLSSFIVFFNNTQGNAPTAQPHLFPIEFNRAMNGKWRDGTPITQNGNGYGGTQETNFIYPNNPNDPNGWSMFTEMALFFDTKCLANVEIEDPLAPNDFTKVDMAFTYHHDPMLNHVENVNLVYDRTPELQQLYDSGFEGCDFQFCTFDCVWTGDANRDSIVSNLDILHLGLAHSATGSPRDKPLIWSPFEGINWNQTVDGIDLKHADCSGNGSIDLPDFEWVDTHYGNSYKKGETVDYYQNGPEITIVSDTNNPIDELDYYSNGKGKIKINQAEEIFGLAFTLEFNPAYLKVTSSSATSLWGNVSSNRHFSKINNTAGKIDFAYVRIDGNNETSIEDIIANITFEPQLNNTELIQTYLRIKNIKAILNDGSIINYGAKPFLVNINNPDGIGQILSNKNIADEKITIYPNPASNMINIKMDKMTTSDFTIFDLNGNVLLQKNNKYQKELQIPIHHLSPGVYILKIEQPGYESFKKIIKL